MVEQGTPSAQYSVTIRLEYPHESGWIAKIASVISRQRGTIGAMDLVQIHKGRSLRDYTIECASTDQAEKIIQSVGRLEGVTVRSVSDNTFLMHLGGKLQIASKVSLKTRADLSMAYTPGVARVCMAIHKDPRTSFNLTIRKNCVAVVSDGSAVLGLGNIGPHAAMPVMEGKAILFKEFASVDAFPLCVDTQDPEEIISFCQRIAPAFGGINLEDIAAPKCFHIEDRLKEILDIPVFHDDQHGTAVVVLAGLINALKVTGKRRQEVKVVVSGAGAAGLACTKALKGFGISDIVVCDSKGAIHKDRDVGDNPAKVWMARKTNPKGRKGTLQKVIRGADLFLGLSAPELLSRRDIEKMNRDPIIFAMSNPVPEILPEETEGLAAVMATGRSDYPNQINNVLAFPGIFRGALDSRAGEINERMKRAAAYAIADIISSEELAPDYVIPSVFNRRVSRRVAAAVAREARNTGVARRIPKGASIYHR